MKINFINKFNRKIEIRSGVGSKRNQVQAFDQETNIPISSIYEATEQASEDLNIANTFDRVKDDMDTWCMTAFIPNQKCNKTVAQSCKGCPKLLTAPWMENSN